MYNEQKTADIMAGGNPFESASDATDLATILEPATLHQGKHNVSQQKLFLKNWHKKTVVSFTLLL